MGARRQRRIPDYNQDFASYWLRLRQRPLPKIERSNNFISRGKRAAEARFCRRPQMVSPRKCLKVPAPPLSPPVPPQRPVPHAALYAARENHKSALRVSARSPCTSTRGSAAFSPHHAIASVAANFGLKCVVLAKEDQNWVITKSNAVERAFGEIWAGCLPDGWKKQVRLIVSGLPDAGGT